MTHKIVNSVKYLLVFSIALFSIIACEKDFEDIGVNLVDNNIFNTNSRVFDVIAYTKNIDSSRVDGLPRYLLGVYNTSSFGLLEASIVSQVGVPSEVDFGTNPVIDTVILNIPYFSTRLGTKTVEDATTGEDITVPDFRIDSIFGNKDKEYIVKVNQLSTFLNTLDPEDPTKLKRYYSNEDYDLVTELGVNDNFIPSKNDTMLIVNRPLLNDKDTIKATPVAPSLKLGLDKGKIEDIFITNATASDLSSFQNFSNYFRGVMIQAIEKTDGEGAAMLLDLSQATISIYYTNEVDAEKAKQTMIFPLTGITAATYTRDYGNSEAFQAFTNANTNSDFLYVQGDAGSIAEMDLDIDVNEIRTKNWLINGAILDFYVDESKSPDTIPQRLYLYKTKEIEQNVYLNTVIKDVISEFNTLGIQGTLQRGTDENNDSFLRYRFSITDYISDVLSADVDQQKPLSRLALKIYQTSDQIQTNSFGINVNDTIVRNFNWSPSGVVLKGNPSVNNDQRLKLTIYYSEKND